MMKIIEIPRDVNGKDVFSALFNVWTFWLYFENQRLKYTTSLIKGSVENVIIILLLVS